MTYLFLALDKSVEWVVAVLALTAFIIMRSTQLPWLERIPTGLISAALAFSFSEPMAARIGIDEATAAVLIMLFSVGVLNAVLSVSHDKTFLQDVLRKWLLKQLNIKGNDDA